MRRQQKSTGKIYSCLEAAFIMFIFMLTLSPQTEQSVTCLPNKLGPAVPTKPNRNRPVTVHKALGLVFIEKLEESTNSHRNTVVLPACTLLKLRSQPLIQNVLHVTRDLLSASHRESSSNST